MYHLGLFNHEQLYSHKFINAEITDSAGRIHVVHIKNSLGNYFVTKIDGQTYVFRIKNPVYTYHAFGLRTIRKIYYNTDHYMPISMADYKALQKVIDINKLPKIDRTLFNVLRYLGKTERADFKEHDMESVFDFISKNHKTNQYAEEAKNMKNFLDHLHIDKIVTPLKEVTEYFQDDMITTDPQFFGDVLPAYQRLDNEDKKITNTPVRGKKPIVKILLIVMAIVVVGLVVHMANSSGMFKSITSPFDSVGDFFKTQGGAGGRPGQPPSSTLPPECQGGPEACKAAVDSGKVKLSQLPPSMQQTIQNYKAPTAKPQSQTIELTP